MWELSTQVPPICVLRFARCIQKGRTPVLAPAGFRATAKAGMVVCR